MAVKKRKKKKKKRRAQHIILVERATVSFAPFNHSVAFIQFSPKLFHFIKYSLKIVYDIVTNI